MKQILGSAFFSTVITVLLALIVIGIAEDIQTALYISFYLLGVTFVMGIIVAIVHYFSKRYCISLLETRSNKLFFLLSFTTLITSVFVFSTITIPDMIGLWPFILSSCIIVSAYQLFFSSKTQIRRRF